MDIIPYHLNFRYFRESTIYNVHGLTIWTLFQTIAISPLSTPNKQYLQYLQYLQYSQYSQYLQYLQYIQYLQGLRYSQYYLTLLQYLRDSISQYFVLPPRFFMTILTLLGIDSIIFSRTRLGILCHSSTTTSKRWLKEEGLISPHRLNGIEIGALAWPFHNLKLSIKSIHLVVQIISHMARLMNTGIVMLENRSDMTWHFTHQLLQLRYG